MNHGLIREATDRSRWYAPHVSRRRVNHYRPLREQTLTAISPAWKLLDQTFSLIHPYRTTGIGGTGYRPNFEFQYSQDRALTIPGGAPSRASRKSSSVKKRCDTIIYPCVARARAKATNRTVSDNPSSSVSNHTNRRASASASDVRGMFLASHFPHHPLTANNRQAVKINGPRDRDPTILHRLRQAPTITVAEKGKSLQRVLQIQRLTKTRPPRGQCQRQADLAFGQQRIDINIILRPACTWTTWRLI